ncbi:unnamed protein product, partial [Sphacelaria rigidula]
VYEFKRKAGGEIERHKPHLVAREFTHRPGVDLFEAFSPVIGSGLVHTILAVSAMRGWKVRALDHD